MTQDENELLTRTNQGTAMGHYLRSFWIPCMLLSEVPAADEPPVRLRLLGEDLVVFRDTAGRIGVLDELCPHRRASLFFGRNEECGLRCVYHGWKYDIEGNCVDMPSEPPTSNYKSKIKATAYSTQEAGGLLWVYMGDKASQPQLPDFEWLNLPENHRYASRWEQECNSIQAMEGELDAAHVSFLHRKLDRLDDQKHSLSGSYFHEDRAPRCRVVDTDYGFINASCREVEEDKAYWRMNQFLLPFYTMIAAGPESARMTRMWIPKDDTHCWVIAVSFRPDCALGEAELAGWRNGDTLHRKVVPGTTQPLETRANDYLIDRVAQKRISFTGIAGVRAQDAMATESAGPIVDRTKEHLGTSDVGIVRMRRRLMAEARAVVSGAVPPLATSGSLYRVRAGQALLDRARNFEDDDRAQSAIRC